jgi:hypothetical protein
MGIHPIRNITALYAEPKRHYFARMHQSVASLKQLQAIEITKDIGAS